jgi:NAD(P)-dependent dehydrogenase (short-subunit alcohol dehydrogenase family)
MDLELDGNAALCTAASSGLGLASARALAAAGADVAICGRTPEHLEAAAEDLEGAGDGDVLAVEADLTERAQVEALVEQTVDRFGGLDHLVTSAGGPPSGSFADVADEDWYGAFDTLVMSAVWATRFARPHLEASDAGSIVAITSRSVVEVIDDLVLSNAVRRAEYDSYDEGLADWGEGVPLGRMGQPEELGDVVAFLSSERASYVTGTSLPIDGGSTRE